jgi:hypothetical protein
VKTLIVVVVLLAVAIAGFGFYRGWFRMSTDNTDQKPSATFTMDKDKIHEDEQKAKDAVKGLGHEAKDKVDDRTVKTN